MNAQLAYLETEVATACPPKLRLLLIEAALRLACQTRSSGQNRLPHEMGQSVCFLKRVLLQLVTSVDDENHALAEKIKSVYRYLLCTVVEVELTGDTQKLCDVEKVLQVERETWRILTDRYIAEISPQEGKPSAALVSHSMTDKFRSQEKYSGIPLLAQVDCIA